MSGFRIMAQRCNQCLFGPNKIVSDARRRQILRECARKDSHFICHKATIQDKEVCCRGFYNADPYASNLMRIASRLGVIEIMEEDTTK